MVAAKTQPLNQDIICCWLETCQQKKLCWKDVGGEHVIVIAKSFEMKAQIPEHITRKAANLLLLWQSSNYFVCFVALNVSKAARVLLSSGHSIDHIHLISDPWSCIPVTTFADGAQHLRFSRVMPCMGNKSHYTKVYIIGFVCNVVMWEDERLPPTNERRGRERIAQNGSPEKLDPLLSLLRNESFLFN